MSPLIRCRWSIPAATLTLGVSIGAPLLAQQRPDSLLTVASYLDLEQVGDAQIAPDGKTIVFTRSWVDKINDRFDSAIWIMNVDGTRQRFLTKGSSPTWSPDGTRIAYIGLAEEPKGPQIFVRWMDAEGASSQISRLTEAPSTLKWSPDGKWLGFTMFVPKASSWPIDLPAAPPNAKWTAPPRIVDRLHYRVDRVGFHRTGVTELFTIPSEGGSARQITTTDRGIGPTYDGIALGGNWDWLAGGKGVVFVSLLEADADTVLQDASLYTVDLAGGAPKRLTSDRGLWTKPVVSPDGKLIAFVGHPYARLTMHTSDLYVMNPDGSGIRNISAGLDRDPAFFGGGALLWAPDGSGLYFSPEDRGTKNIVFAPLTGGGVRKITTGNHMLTLASMSKAGELVAERTSFQEPTQVVRVTTPRGAAADIATLTTVNRDFLAGKRLATAEEIWYPSTNGTRVQGWIVKPPGFDRAKKYPLLLEIHGGPQGMYNVGFDMMWQVFASSGYVVLYTNPRGSTGYGNTFMTAIDKNYPGPDFEDLMAGVDTVIGRGYIDDKQLYVSGCSGGGILTSWVITHTTRFAGAAVRCPITNWISFAGGSDVPLFAHSFFEKPFWEAPEAWLVGSPGTELEFAL